MKDNSFAQYISKQKIKGNYTSELDENKLTDWLKKGKYNALKLATGNMSDKDIELYRVTGDFSDKSFREAIITKCVDAVQKKAKEAAAEGSANNNLDTKKLKEILEEIEPEKVQDLALPIIKETVKNIINKIVGLAKGINSGNNPNTEPNQNDSDEVRAAKEKAKKIEQEDNLYAGGTKGYKYSWVQKDKLYIYFDSEKAARDFLREHLREQKHLEIDESVISKMFSIEKCIRNKGKVYDKVKTEKRHYSKESPIEHSEFDTECSKLIFDKIKDELIKNAKNARYGKKIPVGRITWSWSDEDIKKFLNDCVKTGITSIQAITAESEETTTKKGVEDVFKAELQNVINAAIESGKFLYAKGTAKGNINLNFETLDAAEYFKERFEDSAKYGTLSNAADGKANSKFIEEEKGKADRIPQAQKLKAKIILMAEEHYEQIKVTKQEAAEAKAKLNKEGKKIETYAVKWTLTADAQEEQINKVLKTGLSQDPTKLSEMVSTALNKINEIARQNKIIYAEYTHNGEIILHFAQQDQAKQFINTFNETDEKFGILSNIAKSEVFETNAEKFIANDRSIKNNNAEAILQIIQQKLEDQKNAIASVQVKRLIVTVDKNELKKVARNKGDSLFESMITAFNREFSPIKLSSLIAEDNNVPLDENKLIKDALKFIQKQIEMCATYMELARKVKNDQISWDIVDDKYILKTAGISKAELENIQTDLEERFRDKGLSSVFKINIEDSAIHVSSLGDTSKKTTTTNSTSVAKANVKADAAAPKTTAKASAKPGTAATKTAKAGADLESVKKTAKASRAEKSAKTK